jgi:hypothetical protein
LALGTIFIIKEPFYPSKIFILRIISIIIIAWSVLGRLGWECLTWTQETVAEQLDKFWFGFIYYIGLFGTLLSFMLTDH